MNARKFLWRWNARILRREWRQHLAIFGLVATAVALSVAGILAAYHLVEPPENTFGTAKVIASTSGDSDLARQALDDQGHPYGIVQSADLAVPGSIRQVKIKVVDPENEVTDPLVDLLDGRWPSEAGEVALTDRAELGDDDPDPLHLDAVGTTVSIRGVEATVVGLIENPTNFDDEFVLTADLDPFQVPTDTRTTLFLIDAEPSQVTFPAGLGRVSLATRNVVVSARTGAALAVSGISAIAMVEVALLVGAGFAVLARRRTRQYGLLGAAGATPRQIRSAATSAGAILGMTASAVGLVVGLTLVLSVLPSLETTVGHRISLAVPWWTVVPTLVLATSAAALAARWPSRPLSRRPVAHLLGALRPVPAPTGRLTILGAVLTVIGTVLIIIGFTRINAVFSVLGIVFAPIGLLLLAPVLVDLIGRWSARLPMTARLGGRAVARHNRRSAAVVAALAIALGIPIGAAVVTTSIDGYNEAKVPNLEDNAAIGWIPGTEQQIPHVPAFLQDGDRSAIDQAIDAVQLAVPNATVAPIEVAVTPNAPKVQENFDRIGSVAAVVPHFAVTPGSDCTNCDIYAFGTVDDNGEEILYRGAEAWVATDDLLRALDVGPVPEGASALARTADLDLASSVNLVDGVSEDAVLDPTLPANPVIAPLLLSPATVDNLGLESLAIGVLVVADTTLTADDRDQISAAMGETLFVEFQDGPGPTSTIRLISLLVGLAIGLGVAAAAVSLYTTESADDIRILRSIGADPSTARRLSASVAAALAGAGALIALLIGYLGLVPLLTVDEVDFPFVVPWTSLGTFLILFPTLAAAAGWFFNRGTDDNLARTQ